MIYAGGSTFWSCGYKYTSPNYMAVVSQSTDGGSTWIRHSLYSGTQYGYIRAIAVDPTNSNNVYALGYENSTYTLYTTTNAGTSWTPVTTTGYSGMPYDLMVDPSNPSHLAAATSGGLYHSTNGGANWSKVTSAFSTSYSLYQSDLLGGLVICTTSGIWVWSNWTGTPTYYGEDPGVPGVQCVIETPESYLVAGTLGASAWRSYCGTSVEEGTFSPVENLAAVTVSPNPVCNQFAALTFSLPAGGHTNVSIYDVSGRIVRELSSGEMATGAHQLSLSTDNIQPGVYFAVVRTGETVLSGRFVVAE